MHYVLHGHGLMISPPQEQLRSGTVSHYGVTPSISILVNPVTLDITSLTYSYHATMRVERTVSGSVFPFQSESAERKSPGCGAITMSKNTKPEVRPSRSLVLSDRRVDFDSFIKCDC